MPAANGYCDESEWYSICQNDSALLASGRASISFPLDERRFQYANLDGGPEQTPIAVSG